MRKSWVIVGSRIKFLRESSGFTQKNIADYLKVDQSLISKIEAGERPISADLLERVAILFGCSIAVFHEQTADIDLEPLSFALRASEISAEDLEIVSAINKIALNSIFMTKLLEGEVL